MSERCDLCGKYRKDKDVVEVQGNNNERWVECKDCCSEFDYNFYFKNNPQGEPK